MWIAWRQGSRRGACDLAVVLCRLHLQDVRDNAVDGYVPDEAREEQLLCDVGTHQSQGWETQQDPGQSAGQHAVQQRNVDNAASIVQQLHTDASISDVIERTGAPYAAGNIQYGTVSWECSVNPRHHHLLLSNAGVSTALIALQWPLLVLV